MPPSAPPTPGRWGCTHIPSLRRCSYCSFTPHRAQNFAKRGFLCPQHPHSSRALSSRCDHARRKRSSAAIRHAPRSATTIKVMGANGLMVRHVPCRRPILPRGPPAINRAPQTTTLEGNAGAAAKRAGLRRRTPGGRRGRLIGGGFSCKATPFLGGRTPRADIT